MTAQQIIILKRDGHALSESELRFMIHGFITGEIPDYQMAALLMAIYCQGMSFDETYLLTKIMIESGEQVDFSQLRRFPIDKHSTGGVGDKVSLILAPLVASAGVAVPMISGRGLGHSGGTLDKLEAIPGFRTNLTLPEFIRQVETIGVAMIGQTAEIVPADQKIYALRDSTATVASLPLVAASILSKKIAEGARALVLDVKMGRGAFFKSEQDGLKLAETIIAIGEKFGLQTTALMTAMDQPLGCAVGNWLETLEAIETLKSKGPKDLLELTFVLGAEMLYQAKIVADLNSGRQQLVHLLESGAAYEKFLTLVQCQGGDTAVIENPDQYPKSRNYHMVRNIEDGYIYAIDALKIGLLAMELGAGRKKITDKIDYRAGILLKKKVGEAVVRDEPLAEIFSSVAFSDKYLEAKIKDAIHIKSDRVEKPPLILNYINKKGKFTWQNS